jgi:hypothetical protein
MADEQTLALRIDGQDYALEPDRILLIGSAADCDLRLARPGVAGRHARIAVTATGAELQDLGAGTRVNGRAAERIGLESGDVIQLGGVDACIVLDSGRSLILPIPAMVAQRRAAQADAGGPAPMQPDAPGRPRRRSAAALPLRRSGEATFADQMADELRRAPWFSMSLLAHAILLLLLWWWLQPTPAGRAEVRVGVIASEAPLLSDSAPGETSDRVEPEASAPEPPMASEPEQDLSVFSRSFAVDTPPVRRNDLERLAGVVVGRKQGGDNGARPGAGDLEQLGPARPEFLRTVSEARKSGLEIVFVLDSTGSMGGTIAEARQHLVHMLDVLQTLVPDARFGFVVYRDRHRREAYVTRALPLGTDSWRLANFANSIEAGGGGDRPEAVREGLAAAFAQDWRKGARRVVVLAGDAPPHPDSEGQILREVRAFCSDGRSSVHAVVTARHDDVLQAFRRIAEQGRGVCTGLSDRSLILQRVLSLAFGRTFEQDLQEVSRRVAERRQATDARSLELARSGGPALREALSEPTVRPELVAGLCHRTRRRVATQLIGWLGDPGLPETGRQAIAYVLTRIFDLPQPPLDPLAGGPAAEPQLRALRLMLDRIPE